MTDEEYAECFMSFWGIRTQIARLLTHHGLEKGVKILDIPSGHGVFALEIARVISRGQVHGIGLLNDVQTFKAFCRSLPSEDQQYLTLIDYHVMDATHLGFKPSSFDFVVNFLGFEDINMTRGQQGVQQALRECSRVLKPGGILQLTLCLEGNTPDERVARDVFSLLGCRALFHPKEWYIEELSHCGIPLLDEHWFHTHRKMTVSQAKEEISFACREIPRLFSSYGVTTMPFESLWDKVGDRIEAHGMAYYSHLCVLIGQKR
jgi:ubiquinone/menaquinone biosynthesis C-methylase UbiE